MRKFSEREDKDREWKEQTWSHLKKEKHWHVSQHRNMKMGWAYIKQRFRSHICNPSLTNSFEDTLENSAEQGSVSSEPETASTLLDREHLHSSHPEHQEQYQLCLSIVSGNFSWVLLLNKRFHSYSVSS